MSLPQFLVPSAAFGSSVVILEGPELHHLRVRRVRVGEPVLLSDGLGNQTNGVVVEISRDRACIRLHPVDDHTQLPNHARLSVGVGLLKGRKLDDVVERLTELGVAEILVFTSERSIPEPTEARLERLNRIVRSAAKQSQRRELPVLNGPLRFEDLIHQRDDECRLLFWEGQPPADSPLAAPTAATARVLALIGPEGGYSDAEVSAATACGFQLASLGARPLRAETAAVAAATLCQALLGELGTLLAR